MEIQIEHMDSGTTSSTQLDGVCISTSVKMPMICMI